MIAELVLAGIEGGSWDAVERTMTWPRCSAIMRARAGTRRQAGRPGDFVDLVRFLGADPASGRGTVVK
jgi:hypothetical protein